MTGAKTIFVGERRCTLGVACIRSGVWAPTVSIDPSRPGEQRELLTSTPEQSRTTAAEAMLEAERMAERYINLAALDPAVGHVMALPGSGPKSGNSAAS